MWIPADNADSISAIISEISGRYIKKLVGGIIFQRTDFQTSTPLSLTVTVSGVSHRDRCAGTVIQYITI
ncbi:hypothetical protein SAMN05444280_1581 [Tangfeifania diversioriginum]|uniref:Uncharacterized protein n=1 Tax=Tangfeifania diversioriginum TaxID=1168035 RepID=A0A1M6PDU3_9BACT|nr:hypothetical protein SAMN05444280_1581 [Tangfeifania diversioriginum]